MTPLCGACEFDLVEVALALLASRANIDFATPPGHPSAGFTPPIYAAIAGRSGVAKLLLKRGADGTQHTTQAVRGHPAGSTALDIARLCADSFPDCAEPFTVLRKRCCSACGMTSPGLSAMTAGAKQHLKRCGNCPARGSRARYCSKECQRVDWVLRHREECAKARWAREAAGTEV